MTNIQNEFYYKSLLHNKIEKFINEVTKDDNELGWISNNMVANMTEAAWLVIKQSIDLTDYLETEGVVK
jgi:hypothetical protein